MDSWKQTARNISISNGVLEAELKAINGNWIKNKIKYNEGDQFHNLDGYLTKLWIPPNIFQTHKSQEYISSNKELKKAQESWKKHKLFNYKFYSDKEQDEFMKTYFADIYDAYSKLIMPVMKADLWRYCVVYHYGGIYADSDTLCISDPMKLLSNYFLNIVPENKEHFCQWVFSASRGSPIIKRIIDISVRKIRKLKEFKGEHLIHSLTGPGVFTEGILEWMYDSHYPIIENKTKFKTNMKINFFNTDFHNKDVQHLFSGQWDNGWCKQREKLL